MFMFLFCLYILLFVIVLFVKNYTFFSSNIQYNTKFTTNNDDENNIIMTIEIIIIEIMIIK